MSISGRRLLHSSLVVLVVVSVLQIWVCCDSCKAGAIRVLPIRGTVNVISKVETKSKNMAKGLKAKTSKDALFHKYFSGISASNFNKTEQGFEDSKRRVPSCPDQLHN